MVNMFWHQLLNGILTAVIVINSDSNKEAVENDIAIPNLPVEQVERTSSKEIMENNSIMRNIHPEMGRTKLSASAGDDIATDLQHDVDNFTKNLTDLETKSKSTTSQVDLITLMNEIRSMDFEQSYRKVDALYAYGHAERLKLKDRLDNVFSKIITLEIQLSNRVINLENEEQKTNVNKVIENIRIEKVETAIKTFENVKLPLAVIPHLVNEAFGIDIKYFKPVLDFIVKLKLNQEDGERVKSTGFKILLEKLSKKMFESDEGSNCLFRLAWEADNFLTSVTKDPVSKDMLTFVFRLPSCVRLIYRNFFRIRRDREGCKFPSEDERQKYLKNNIRDDDFWRAASREIIKNEKVIAHGGDNFVLVDVSQQMQLLEGNGFLGFFWKVRLVKKSGGLEDFENLNRAWRPILKSDEEVQLKNIKSGMFLSFDNIGSCYKYKLSRTPVNWFVVRSNA